MDTVNEVLNQTVYGNNLMNYALALGILVLGFIAVKVIQLVLIKRLKVWAESTANSLDDFVINVVSNIIMPIAYLLVLYAALNVFVLNPSIQTAVNRFGVIIITIMVTRLILVFVRYAFDVYWEKSKGDVNLKRSLVGIFKLIRILFWGMALIFLLDNFGFKVSSVIAGLGVGGVAVALAAQTILKDLFCYFAIIFDRPFVVGHFIIVGDLMGTVEHIGIMTTRLTSLGGEQLVFSNSDLINSRVRNYKRMKKRRIVFKVGVVYQTSAQLVKEIPDVLEGIVKRNEGATFDRAHFASFGDSSLVYEIVYYVNSGDYTTYMNIQQEFNFAIKEEFENRGIEFAYPTQTLFVQKED